MGVAEKEESNFTGAVYYFRQALTIDPKDIGALVGIGSSLEKLGNHSAARKR